MKYSVSSRQTGEYLKKADEIHFEYRDRKAIIDFIAKYPEAQIALDLPYVREEDIDWKELENNNIMSQGRLILGITFPSDLKEAKRLNIKTYFRPPVHTFQELSDLKAAGVDQVILGCPVFFQMDKVRQLGLSVRATANSAFLEGTWSPMEGWAGTYIRPEDIELYEPYVDVIQFTGSLTEEQALFRIYAEQHRWSGELNMVVKDLNYSATNRMIPPEFGKTRLNCRQRCMEPSASCHMCRNYLYLANPDLIRRITEQN